MILVKIIGKIALLPLIFLISMACFTINVTTKIACHFAVWFRLLIVIGLVYTAVHKLWNQTILFGIMGTVSFGTLFGIMMFESFLEEFNDWEKRMLRA
jgi:hypothetical protein